MERIQKKLQKKAEQKKQTMGIPFWHKAAFRTVQKSRKESLVGNKTEKIEKVIEKK